MSILRLCNLLISVGQSDNNTQHYYIAYACLNYELTMCAPIWNIIFCCLFLLVIDFRQFLYAEVTLKCYVLSKLDIFRSFLNICQHICYPWIIYEFGGGSQFYVLQKFSCLPLIECKTTYSWLGKEVMWQILWIFACVKDFYLDERKNRTCA